MVIMAAVEEAEVDMTMTEDRRHIIIHTRNTCRTTIPGSRTSVQRARTRHRLVREIIRRTGVRPRGEAEEEEQVVVEMMI